MEGKGFMKHETIIIKKEAWKFLRNLDRTTRGYSELSDEALERSWSKFIMRNGGANSITHPIGDDEIRIDKGSFGISWNRVISVCYENDFEWRKDGYMMTEINL